MSKEVVTYGDMTYNIEVLRQQMAPPTAPKLITVCYNTTESGVLVTKACVDAVLKMTPEPFELWVVDNASPAEHSQWLRETPGINVIINQTPPIPKQKQSRLARMGLKRVDADAQMKVGSYANAIGLELGVHFIDDATEHVFVMHNDVLPLQPYWLSFLQSKLTKQVRAIGMLRDKHPERIEALHVSGLLFDYQLFRQLDVDFFPQLPRLDVGDRITEAFEEAGYITEHCRNTYNEPESEAWLPDNKWRDKLPHVAWSFDDNQVPIYVHLARGTPKSKGTYWKEGRATPEAFVAFAHEVVLR